MACVEDFSTEDVCQEQVPDISQSFLEALKEHRIDGRVLLELTDEYLRELAPLLGDRIKIKRVIRFALSTKSPVSFFLQLFFTTLIFSFQVKYRYFLSYTTLVHMQAISDATSAQPNSWHSDVTKTKLSSSPGCRLISRINEQVRNLTLQTTKRICIHAPCMLEMDIHTFLPKCDDVHTRIDFPRQLSFQFYSDKCCHYHISPSFQ